jgi:ligand-binding sensor domain-containing protein/signal transduction histidine kinase
VKPLSGATHTFRLSRIAVVRFVCVYLLFSASLLDAQSPPPWPPARAHHILDDYQLDRWTTQDGLPDNEIAAILQTRDGYLWLGTRKGLVRFDGMRFVVFSSENTPAFLHNIVSSLLEDRGGSLWIGISGGGLLRLDHGKFLAFTQKNGMSSNFVNSLCEDRAGVIWAGTAGGGLNRIDHGTVTHLTTNDGLLSDHISSLYVDRSGVVWIGSGNGAVQHYANGILKTIRTEQRSVNSKVYDVCEDNEGRSWIGSAHGFLEYRQGRFFNHFASGLLGSTFIHALDKDADGAIWLCTEGAGLVRFDGRSRETVTIADGLPTNFVGTVCIDRDGDIWFSADRGGLHRLRRKLVTTLSTRDGLPTNNIRSVFEDRVGTLWIGTNGAGIVRLLHNHSRVFTVSDGLTSNFVHPIEEDTAGTIWIGTWGGGITLLHNGHFRRAPLSYQYIRTIHQDRTGTVWIGTNGSGLIRLQGDEQVVFNTSKGLSNNLVACIAEDRTGTLWVGTSGGGINRIAGDSITSFTRRYGLSSNFVPTILIDSEQTLWIGTNGGGLNRLRDGVCTSWTTKDGLVDDIIFSILEDETHHLWLGTTKGIERVDKNDLEMYANHAIASLPVLTLGHADGMRSLECSGTSQNGACRTHDGQLWFATENGLVEIDPRTIKKDTSDFPVYIEELLVDKTPVDLRGNVVAQYDRGELEIHYTAVNFLDARAMRFRYTLDGFDSDWHHAGTRRAAYYTNIPPGTYRFRVALEKRGALVSPSFASLQIMIRPPFWMTFWFRFLTGIVFFGFVAGAVRFISTKNLQRKLRELEAQNALERERTRISKDMHDELGASLTKIALLSDVAQRSVDDPQGVSNALDRISNAAREVAGTMDEIVWAVNPKNDTVEGFVGYTAQYAEEYLALSNIHCRLDIPQELPDQHISSDVRHNVFLVIKESLNNVVKHSHATAVDIGISIAGASMAIEVRDNGTGFARENVGTFSDGLSNMEKRMADIDAQFRLQSEPGKGTTLVIAIPLRG